MIHKDSVNEVLPLAIRDEDSLDKRRYEGLDRTYLKGRGLIS